MKDFARGEIVVNDEDDAFAIVLSSTSRMFTSATALDNTCS